MGFSFVTVFHLSNMGHTSRMIRTRTADSLVWGLLITTLLFLMQTKFVVGLHSLIVTSDQNESHFGLRLAKRQSPPISMPSSGSSSLPIGPQMMSNLETGSTLGTGLRGLTKEQIERITSGFQINSNTIIRTQDSRSQGAVYLNETELPSNEDCVVWCWSHPQCNLAVYEDKVSLLLSHSSLSNNNLT